MRPFIISFALIFYSCSNAQDNRSIYIFIPMNYTGWVNIVFNDSSSSAEPLKFDNGYVYFITGDPQNFRVKSDIYTAGSYKMNYYYYNVDSTRELSWLDYPKNNILFQRTLGSTDNKIYRPHILTYSFYVSKEPLDDSKVSIDMLPKNKILQ
jgi:hypothetical protein